VGNSRGSLPLASFFRMVTVRSRPSCSMIPIVPPLPVRGTNTTTFHVRHATARLSHSAGDFWVLNFFLAAATKRFPEHGVIHPRGGVGLSSEWLSFGRGVVRWGATPRFRRRLGFLRRLGCPRPPSSDADRRACTGARSTTRPLETAC